MNEGTDLELACRLARRGFNLISVHARLDVFEASFAKDFGAAGRPHDIGLRHCFRDFDREGRRLPVVPPSGFDDAVEQEDVFQLRGVEVSMLVQPISQVAA